MGSAVDLLLTSAFPRKKLRIRGDVFVPRHMAGMWDLTPCLLTPTFVGSMADDSGGIE